VTTPPKKEDQEKSGKGIFEDEKKNTTRKQIGYYTCQRKNNSCRICTQ